jgi:hypothetical protein
VPRKHPAETAGAATGLSGLVAALAAHNTLAAIIAGAAFVPAGVTWIVHHGGLKGAVYALWRGR